MISEQQESGMQIHQNTNESQWHPEQNELHINFTLLLNTPCTVILTGWKRGISWKVDGELEPHLNPFEPSLFPIEFIEHQCLKAWVEQIPPSVIGLLRLYKGNAFGMLNMVSRHDTALKLFLTEPTLFWLAFRRAMQNGWREAEFVRLCERKSTDIMKACQLPSSTAALRILNKITATQFAQHQQDIIEQLFAHDYEALNARDIIPDHLIRFLLHYREWNGLEILMTDWEGDLYSRRLYMA